MILPNEKNYRKLFVGGLSWETTESKLNLTLKKLSFRD